jgi:hypothetical protein
MSTSPARGTATVALAIFAGAAGGLAAAFGLHAYPRVDSKVPSEPSADQAVFSQPIAATPALENQVLTARVQALEHQLQAKESAAPAPSSEPAPMPAPPSPEESKQMLFERQRTLVADHQKDPLDPVWSVATVKNFDADFEAMAQNSPVKLLSIDCRTTSCLATVRWENYATALAKGSVLAHYPYSTTCARQVVQPPPDDENAPYVSTVVFDCTSARTEAQR